MPGISLLLLIPFIFAGLCALGFIGAWYLLADERAVPTPDYLLWVLVMVLLTALTAGVITWHLFRPMRRFAQRAARLTAVAPTPMPSSATAPAAPPRDELEEYDRLFEQVGDRLSELDAHRFFPEITGQSRPLLAALAQMFKVAPTDTTVLIYGETGTGKELAARGIVAQSKRHDRPLVTINCAAIPEGLLESELFGHEKGAFTGAVVRRRGKFEEADGGTVFLDEIGEVPLAVQVKLLRVLQEKVIERVGGNNAVTVNVRIIAATHRDLAKLVAAGQFREDLFYRLNVFTIMLPPLRLRRDDIPLLAQRLLAEQGDEPAISPAAMALLQVHDWPGNVRELHNVLQRAALLASERGKIGPEHLPAALRGGEIGAGGNEGTGLDQRLQELERNLIVQALRRADGVQVQAARELGIKERSLHHRIRKYAIDVEEFRGEYK